jgi:hypothetical protein
METAHRWDLLCPFRPCCPNMNVLVGVEKESSIHLPSLR